MMENAADWPAFQVHRRQIGDLKPFKNNARTHSKEQVAQIAESIKQWGWTQPILVDEDDGIIAGHGRLEAALTLGVKEVPVILATGWTDAQKRAYVLADNQIPQNAGWDKGLLKVEIGALHDMEFPVGLAGFDDKFLKDLFKTAEVPNVAPQLPTLNYAVIVRCESEIEQLERLEEFEKQGFKCEALIS